MNRKHRKAMSAETREVIFNVVEYCYTEKNNRGYSHPFEQALKRAAAATGYCERTVQRIRREGLAAAAAGARILLPKKKTRKKFRLDGFQRVTLRNIITSSYTERKEVPSFIYVLETARSELNMKFSREYLRDVLVDKLGYKFYKCRKRRLLLVEKNDVKLRRANYLYRLQQNDALGAKAKLVVYLDGGLVTRCWQEINNLTEGGTINDSTGKKWTLLRTGGRMIFYPVAKLFYKAKQIKDYDHTEVDNEKFTTWIKEKLIQRLPPNVIVALDNAPCHWMQSEKPPTAKSSKQTMIQWLTRHAIPFDNNFLKVQLYELIKRHRPEKVYELEKILTEHGHEVLRLPPNNCDLNPIELVWKKIKQRVAEKNVDKESEEETTLEEIEAFTTAEWVSEVGQVKHLEETYWNTEQQMDREIEHLETTYGDNESSSNYDSSDDESSSWSDSS